MLNTCLSFFSCFIPLDFKTQINPNTVAVDEPMRKPKKMSGVHSPLLPRGDQTQVELGNKYFELLSYPAGPYISFKMSAF